MKTKLSKRSLAIIIAVAVTVLVVLTVFLIIGLGGLDKKGGLTGNKIPNRKYDENEVKAAAGKLIEESIILNEIYWGKGIPYVDDPNLSNGAYHPADEIYLSKLGIVTLEDLKNKTRSVFSSEMCKSQIFGAILDSANNGIQISYVRYYQKFIDENSEVPECIMVNKNYKYFLYDDVEYNYESIKVIGSRGNYVTVSIDCTATNDEGLSSKSTIEVDLIEESDGWKLATPTYSVYRES